jgi:RNA polymerase sigma factor (sigma-70 family)
MGFLKGSDPQAKDLSQEVFIQVWNNLRKFRSDSSPKTWIYRITVNTCLNHLKKEKLLYEKIGEAIRDQPVAVELPANEKDPVNALYTAMAALSEVDRLITGMLLEEIPNTEIASILGINEGNLRVKIHGIKLKLKKLIPHD